MRLRVEAACLLCAVLGAAVMPRGALAQNDLPRPPRLERRADPTPADAPAATPLARTEPSPLPPPIAGSPRPPNAAMLAPLPEDRDTRPDEIIVVGQGWRLPDLGSEWRKKQEESEDTGRFHTTFLPLFDPSRPPQRSEPLLAPTEWQRHGYIELFRMRFGKPAPTE
jgi:hypothetical protein